MLKSVIKGAIVGGIVAYIWSFASWMVLPWHNDLFHSFKSEQYVASVIKENSPEKGVYLIPFLDMKKAQKNDYKKQADAMRKGPVVFAVVSPTGAAPMGAGHFVSNFLTQVAGGALVGMILYLSCCHNYFGRVMIVLFTGLFAGIITYLPAWTWWNFPCDYTIVSILDVTIGWLIVGLILAKVMRPCRCTCGCKGCTCNRDVPPPAT
ncbi:MAG: hypothetical protein HY860_05500 [Chlamydiales bacterium]|nr:hypothetical protein [Chlamydiales bacterium]